MKFDQILIRYGELSTKGKNRRAFVAKLKRSIKYALKDKRFDMLEIEATRDRMYILLNGADYREVADRLKKIFGIQSFSPVVVVEKEIDAIKQAGLDYIAGLEKPISTFKVTTKRADKSFPLETNDINRAVGGHILWHNQQLSVDVKKPDLNLVVEIRKEAAYLTGEIIQGAGGLPLNSSGKAMLMLSGGIDSPVAGYLTMKRGIEVECIHFYSPPFTSERSKQKVLDLAEVLSYSCGHMMVHVVPFTDIQKKIQQQIPENYSMTTTRRLMLRIADAIAEKQGALAIITGESLGQVASQTLHSMNAINEVTTTPIIRPLITADKLEIIKQAEELGTLEISNRPYEDCCTVFTPANPKTMPRREKVNYYESFIEFDELIEAAVNHTETIHVKPGKTIENSEMDDLL
ncbi:tRNA uracil 4-sulfurtransferase ThiI [Bacillus testis]|uniref:tRNA uracil 4-sulfurtransferase ThiI n=1 Tax=Bacillus testis TaxID=1622072 RepID=UPI00067E8124|nr:tRNA uracil 4-sulfurtransferase ThiI [Bacillus testis]